MYFPRSLLVLSTFATVQALAADADSLVQDTLDKFYPANAQALATFNENQAEDAYKLQSCRFAPDTSGSETDEQAKDNGEQAGFCMRFLNEKTVDMADGKRRFLLFVGDNLETSHAMTGAVGLFVFDSKDAGKTWQPVTHKLADNLGEYGSAPSEWSWQQVGPQAWAAVAASGYASTGVSWRNNFLLQAEGKTIRWTDVLESYDNKDANYVCNDEAEQSDIADAKAEELADCQHLTARFAVRKDLPAPNGIFPLEVSLDGFVGLKKEKNGKEWLLKPLKTFKQDKFVFEYDAAKQNYVAPKDFPDVFKDDDK